MLRTTKNMFLRKQHTFLKESKTIVHHIHQYYHLFKANLNLHPKSHQFVALTSQDFSGIRYYQEAKPA